MAISILDKTITNNDCYKRNVVGYNSTYTDFQINGAKGIMLHSVGCNQSRAEIFYKQWNQPNVEVAVHAIVQPYDPVYQCLPWNFKGWHCGCEGNNFLIGVEMTEPDCLEYTHGDRFICHDYEKAKNHVVACYNNAVELFAMLCIKFNFNPKTHIYSHKEGNALGFATGHTDPEHLWSQLELPYTMDTFRRDVQKYIDSTKAEKTYYRVRISWEDVNSQIGAFHVLENAIDFCPIGYKVFDENGNVVCDNSKPCEKCPYKK